MEYYCINDDNSLTIINNDIDEIVEAITSKWELIDEYYFYCFALSDNQIDDRRLEITNLELDKKNLVFKNNQAVGYYVEEVPGILYFDNYESDKLIKYQKNKEFVSGWGEVSEYDSYYLKRKSSD